MPERSEQLESEVKLSVPAVFELPPLIAHGDNPADAAPGIAVAAVSGGRLALRAIYHDTADLRLARAGLTLRHRTGEGRPTWTLKLPAEGARPGDRLEVSVRGTSTTMPEELRSLVTAHVRDSSLGPVVRLTTRRDVWSLRDSTGTEVAELVDDLVSVVSNRKVVARFRELEIERRGIDEGSMDAVVARLTDAGAIVGAFQSKLVRALGPRATAASDVPGPVKVRRNDPAAALVSEAIRSGLRKLLAQDARVRLERPDAVHQMRVACRRLRSDMRTFETFLDPETTDPLREQLSWLAGSLGDARDVEVLRARLVHTFAADPLAPLDPAAFARLDDLLAAREKRALAKVTATLNDPRYVPLLVALVAVAREPATTPLAAEPTKEVLPVVVAANIADLDRRVLKLKRTSPDDRWHAARIRAKRARYAAEAAAGAMGGPAAELGAAMAAVQEVLGDHQDAAVAATEVLGLAAAHPRDSALVLLCGRLAERERAAVLASRAAFPAVWRTASARPLRRWLPKLPELAGPVAATSDASGSPATAVAGSTDVSDEAFHLTDDSDPGASDSVPSDSAPSDSLSSDLGASDAGADGSDHSEEYRPTADSSPTHEDEATVTGPVGAGNGGWPANAGSVGAPPEHAAPAGERWLAHPASTQDLSSEPAPSVPLTGYDAGGHTAADPAAAPA